MEIYQVDPRTINLSKSPSPRDVAHQRTRLVAEGQIEPILLNPTTMSPSTGPRGWIYADAQILAARELAWPTLLVTY